MDKSWNTIVFLFLEHQKLRKFTHMLDEENHILDVEKLKKSSKGWSTTEKFFLDFVLHVYNSSNKIDLTMIDKLDQNNRILIFKALDFRFGREKAI